MITQFRSRYPHGSLISELVKIDHGNYVVRAAVQVDDLILATGLAAASTVEVAEDKARNRALALLDLEGTTKFIRKRGDRESGTSPEVSGENKNHHVDIQTPQEREKMQSKDLGARELDDRSDCEATCGCGVPFPNPVEKEEVKQWEQFSTPENATVPDKETTSVPSTPDYPKKEEMNSPTPVKEEVKPFSTPENATVPDKETTSVPSTPDYPKKEEVNNSTPVSATEEPTTLDFNEIIAQMNGEMKRLGWNKEQGKVYLLEAYGKRSRHFLDDEELLGFLAYLQSLPTSS